MSAGPICKQLGHQRFFLGGAEGDLPPLGGIAGVQPYAELVDCGQDSFGKPGRFFVNMIAELPVDV